MAGDFKHSFKTDRRAELSLVVYNVGFQKCPPSYGWGPGVRDHYLLHYIVSGRGIYETEGRTFVLDAGNAFLARPDAPIYYRADETDPWEYYWVGFSGPAAPLLLAQTPFTPERPVLRPAAGDALRQGLLEIYKARSSDYPGAVRMAGYLQAALGLLMEEAPRRGEDALARYARQGAAFLQQNYSRAIGVEEAARQAGVSRSCLYRAFQSEFGCSPSAYLTRFRIQRAGELLRHSTLPVGAVAASVGFEDPFYFSRAFGREVGCSPSVYRASGKK
ncbi:helix-turn-helix domain-containing protein [Oscillibacter sp.]|uniref:AraC family transcriptional regulator n=1 Tax=Oscillibacter sp. TaxID=1945593 RepID=UPI00260E2C6B|nr:helix-turn-helix domain-containing protein [Oscillibacter sp.]MDD3346104.1 helix-turn-helix domain-containing protein [Oscillibacter sp.]